MGCYSEDFEENRTIREQEEDQMGGKTDLHVVGNRQVPASGDLSGKHDEPAVYLGRKAVVSAKGKRA